MPGLSVDGIGISLSSSLLRIYSIDGSFFL